MPTRLLLSRSEPCRGNLLDDIRFVCWNDAALTISLCNEYHMLHSKLPDLILTISTSPIPRIPLHFHRFPILCHVSVSLIQCAICRIYNRMYVYMPHACSWKRHFYEVHSGLTFNVVEKCCERNCQNTKLVLYPVTGTYWYKVHFSTLLIVITVMAYYYVGLITILPLIQKSITSFKLV